MGSKIIVLFSNTPITADILEYSKDLIVIGASGVSHDNIDLECATRLGIVVVHTISIFDLKE